MKSRQAGLIALVLSCSTGFPAAAEEPAAAADRTAVAAPRPTPDRQEEAGRKPPKEKTTRWVFSWNGWNGLRLGMIQKTPLKNPKPVFGLTPEGPDSGP